MLLKKCWSFDDLPGFFCKLWPRFCINYFNIIQNWKHEKRLETDVSSLRNPVIMRQNRLRFPFGDRCSTNWAIPLNKKCCVVSLAHLQEIWYHRHAVLSSVFQHKNADLSKNLYYRVWYARRAHFILLKIACDQPDFHTSLSWILTTARTSFQSRKPHVIFQRLRCGWVIRIGKTKCRYITEIDRKYSWHNFWDAI